MHSLRKFIIRGNTGEQKQEPRDLCSSKGRERGERDLSCFMDGSESKRLRAPAHSLGEEREREREREGGEGGRERGQL